MNEFKRERIDLETFLRKILADLTGEQPQTNLDVMLFLLENILDEAKAHTTLLSSINDNIHKLTSRYEPTITRSRTPRVKAPVRKGKK